MSEQIIGPNPCGWCGGEYGEHFPDCRAQKPTPEIERPVGALAVATGSGYRIKIEAVGLRKSDAAAYALRLIGMMMQEAHTKGHSCGGETGNASGNWEDAGSPNTELRNAPTSASTT